MKEMTFQLQSKYFKYQDKEIFIFMNKQKLISFVFGQMLALSNTQGEVWSM